MIYLLLSVLSSTLIFVIFKLVKQYGINTLQVIVINYIVACLLGIMLDESQFQFSTAVSQPWFYGALFLGILFIIIFNVMAWTAQKNGLSVASVASKMSVIIPIVFGVYMYNESHGILKVIGIFLALVAVYLSSVKSEKMIVSIRNLWLPITLFIGSGIIDASIKFIQHNYLDESGYSIFSSSIFFFAGLVGLFIVVFQSFNAKLSISRRIIPAGVFLGIVNYGSIYFLLKALNFENYESSTIFTINNVAIVLFSTLVGLLVFKEKLFPKNWFGIGLAIISIILVSLTF